MSTPRERQLELALARQGQTLAEYAVALRAVQTSRAWRLVWALARLRDRLLPPWSARGRAVGRLLTRLGDAFDALLRAAGKGPPPPADLLGAADADYPAWAKRHDASPAELARQRLAPPRPSPTVAIVGPEAGPSANRQTYAAREFCPPGATLPAAGEWVAVVAPGAELAPSALYEAVVALNARPDADLLFADHDETDAAGRRHSPALKPEWSPELMRATPYLGPFLVVRRSLFDSLGGDATDIHDFGLRAGEQARAVVRLPRVLAHVRRHQPPVDWPASVAGHLARVGEPAVVAAGPLPGTCHVTYPLNRPFTVSVIIPNRDSAELLDRCVGPLLRYGRPGLDVTVVENGSTDPETHALYRRLRAAGVRIVEWHEPFNYAAINNLAVRDAPGELLLFLNNDIEPPDSPDWLDALARHALRPGVGAVGAKLLFADDTVQHAGVVLGLFGIAGHGLARYPRAAPGHLGQLLLAREVMAVTGACLMVGRRAFDDVGGFDEAFAVAYNDVDLCLRLRERGHRTLWTPAELYHLESVTRGSDDTPAKHRRLERERELFVARWRALLAAGDPFYSPNLRIDGTDYGLRR